MRRIRSSWIAFIVVLGAANFVQVAGAAAPTAITGAVSAVGGTSATLNGTVNPSGAATDWWFEYGTSTSYGSKTATTGAGSGTTNVAVSKALSGLAPATTYHYRLVAKNSSGTTNGSDGLFTTASPPSAVTGAATGVGPTSATLGGTVDPNGQPTTWYVEYGTSTSYGTKSATIDGGSGTSPQSVSVGVSGLATGKTYHFRLVASSAGGTSVGADAKFVTAEAPTATTLSASSIGSRSARLNGRVDPNGRPTTYLFEYGTSTAYGSKTSTSSVGSGTNPVSVSKSISGLTRGATYHFRIVATSDSGTVAGVDQVFETDSPPTVTTSQATAVGGTSATLGGIVDPNGRSTSWYVEYGRTTSYGSTTSSRGIGSGTEFISVVAAVSRLTAGATYHFRLVATNSLGRTRGADMTFRTAGGPPTVRTGVVDFKTLSLSSARINGTVNPLGLDTRWWFEYGRTRAYGLRTAEVAVSGSADVGVRVSLTGLASGVRWHYRLVARSSLGTTVGANRSFPTAATPRDASGRRVRCTIVGSQARDVLRGTRRADVICGLGGNDRIIGGGGNDVIYGGPGADVIDGNAGNDILRGNDGNDVLRGGSGKDKIYGGRGRDFMLGGTGADVLDGGPGNDVLRGDSGADILRGGSGNDTLRAKDRRRDVVNGGRGRDLAYADRRIDRLVSVERRRYT